MFRYLIETADSAILHHAFVQSCDSRAVAFFISIPLLMLSVVLWLVLGRIVAQLVNEAAFLIGEGNGRPEDVDAGMELGVNHPRGPLAWSEVVGLAHVRGVLDALRSELGEERYRVAPMLRRRAATGEPLGGLPAGTRRPVVT